MNPNPPHEDARLEFRLEHDNLAIARVVGQLLRRNLAIRSLDASAGPGGFVLAASVRGSSEAVRRVVLAFQGSHFVKAVRVAGADERPARSRESLLEVTA